MTIDRQSAIEAVSDIWCEFDIFDNEECRIYEVLTRVIKTLQKLPSAEPQWVLCSERLPESDGRYLVTTAVGFCKVTTMRTFVEEHWWQVESTQAVLDKDVLAWAELPEPC